MACWVDLLHRIEMGFYLIFHGLKIKKYNKLLLFVF